MFSLASMLVFLVALAHTGGVFSEPPDAAGAELVQHMRDYRVHIAGMSPSVLDIQRSLGLTLTVFLVFLGAINLIVAGRDAWVAAGVLRFMAVAGTLCTGALTLLYFAYRIPPPMVSFGLLTLLFAASVWTTRGLAGSTSGSGAER